MVFNAVTSHADDDRICCPGSLSGVTAWKQQDLPSSCETSIVRSPCSRDPGRTDISRPLRNVDIAPLLADSGSSGNEIRFRGSIARHSNWLFTLRREDYSLPTQNSLPVAGQALPRGLVPQGSQRKVFNVLTLQHSLLLSTVLILAQQLSNP